MTSVENAQAISGSTSVLDSTYRSGLAGALARRLTARVSVIVLVGAVAVLIIRPLYEIAHKAFENGARGFHAVGETSDIGQAVEATVWLALGSTAMALVLGIALAWYALRLPRGFGWLSIAPVLPIVMPAVASIMGWVFIFSPRIGYGNQEIGRASCRERVCSTV